MKFDLNKYEKINGREAFERLSNGLSVTDYTGWEFSINFDESDFCAKKPDNELIFGKQFGVAMDIPGFLETQWYVKKPFDVRAEMLARPNEWVGAFQNDTDDWIRVGFDSNKMSTVLTLFSKYKVKPDARYCTVANSSVLEKCIPIEDVPVEELK